MHVIILIENSAGIIFVILNMIIMKKHYIKTGKISRVTHAARKHLEEQKKIFVRNAAAKNTQKIKTHQNVTPKERPGYLYQAYILIYACIYAYILIHIHQWHTHIYLYIHTSDINIYICMYKYMSPRKTKDSRRTRWPLFCVSTKTG